MRSTLKELRAFCGVVEHLRDDFAADLVISALLDLHERWNTTRIEVEMIERETAVVLQLDVSFAAHQQERTLVAGEHLWMLRDQRLQHLFAFIGLL